MTCRILGIPLLYSNHGIPALNMNHEISLLSRKLGIPEPCSAQCAGRRSVMLPTLKRHMDEIHMGGRRGRGGWGVGCVGRGVRRKEELRAHMSRVHGAPKQFKCALCGKEFGHRNGTDEASLGV